MVKRKMKTLRILEMLLALSIVTALVIPVFTIQPAQAVPLNIPPLANDPIVWETRSGWGVDAYNTLSWNPEWLKLRTDTDVETLTEVVVQGLDEYGANIEAKVLVPPGTGQRTFIFTDPHSGQPVPFAKITGIYQQNGTHSDSFEIMTEPVGWEQYLGQYEASNGYWQPGQADPHPVLPPGQYYYTTGKAVLGVYLPAPGIQNVPVEPFNPDPIKILIDWQDYYNVLQPVGLPPDTNQWPFGGAKNDTVITIEGLDQNGSKLIVNVNIHAGDMWVNVDTNSSDIGLHTFSTICKVWGGFKGDSYYFLTHPMLERGLFEYYIRIHHLSLYPGSYDILANPGVDPLNPGGYPGVTTITVALKDIDDHLVYFGKSDNWQGTANGPQPIIINWWTSGGVIHPSYVEMHAGQVIATVNITADTNARTIKVVADANIPKHTTPGLLPAPEMNLLAWTEMTFDGINSVIDTSGWPIHTLLAGYTDRFGNQVTFNAPTRPPLPELLGGPAAGSLTPPWKLDGPIYEISIPLYPGCNLISSPIYPFLIGFNGSSYYTSPWGGSGIPMDLLFGMTSATQTIEAIWWYDASTGLWSTYIPGVTTAPSGMMFNDGVGYWIKAEKSCTLELSGVQMENAPFVPEEYTIYPSWNLIGFTSISQMATADYLESLNTGYIGTGIPIVTESAVGPIWVWDALHQTWSRDPALLWPGQGLWMNYKLAGTADLSP